MAATWQAIFSSFVVLVTALADAHGHEREHEHSHSNPNHNHPKGHDHGHHGKGHGHHGPGHGHHKHAHAHVNTQPHTDAAMTAWKDAHATFYGGSEGTIGGACGFDDNDKPVFGQYTTALSAALFRDGAGCGGCYEIKCDPEKGEQNWCKPGECSVTVTATDFCPGGGLGWCNSPNEHFDLSMLAFLKIAEYKGGIVPVKYRRVPCIRQGGVRYKITGNPWFNLVGITNVAGAGDVVKVEVKCGEEWTELKRNYGSKWETNAKLVGKALTFRITTSDGKTTISNQAAPESWQFGQTYHEL